MDTNPIKTAAREEKHAQRLGDNLVCLACGESRRACLRSARVFEVHHVVGRAHDANLVVTVCLNCHAQATEEQRRAGVDFSSQSTYLETLTQVLASLGSFLVLVGQWLIEHAGTLSTEVARLDRNCPEWRQIPEEEGQ